MLIQSFDFIYILEKLTGQNNWQEMSGPDSGCGNDYWYKSGSSEAYINVDQDHCSISVDDQTIFSGSIQDFPSENDN